MRVAGREAARRKMSSCVQTRHVSAPCDVCGHRPEIIHLPIDPLGFFCERHCPVCRVPRPPTKAPKEISPLELG